MGIKIWAYPDPDTRSEHQGYSFKISLFCSIDQSDNRVSKYQSYFISRRLNPDPGKTELDPQP